ncbi:hypothetical protein PHLGIDRAFT_131196 [Phlebiopsis gigantea 11061_1 CR5-6]|uniref:NAD-dependent epimerase/dehydratase domain-containing protein n=1 Tax=Phlebiopsis gigantea (strain 11061_1 CR5-6) TaxID=745531 RepID=A0A0C3RPS4_PHLG1|nr:hypothetical protein PHLGIDRAFT_131196 [Phlebiopsis gigantea 11061_1 CR5-6]
MPAVTQGKVLVSGANGYIALWVVQSLLDHGFSVRGTVRSESKVAHLKETFKDHGDKLEVVVVPDITKEGAFDEAVKGVDAIAHTASPFHFNAKDPQELITPAVAGTGSILQSALLHANDTVKRIVLTASCATVLTPDGVARTYSEADWNEYSIKQVETKGSAASPAEAYRASKTLAERAAWKFFEINKEKLHFDLAVLNPPFVFGPVLHEVGSPDALNTSMQDWYDTVVRGVRSNEQLATVGSSFIDVRDVGLAHTLALEKEAAGGERIIIASEAYNWQDWVNAAHAIDPSLPAGNTSYDSATAAFPVKYDTSKSERTLGIKYRTIKESTADTLNQFREKGWIA